MQTLREWESHRNNLTDTPTLPYFTNYITNRANFLETLEESRQAKSKTNNHNEKTSNSNSFTLSTNKNLTKIKNQNTNACNLCQGKHRLFSCPTFRSMTVEARKQAVKNAGVCSNCLRAGHELNACRLTHCKYCTERHNTLLHEHVHADNHDHVALTTNNQKTKSHILLSTARVKVYDSQGEAHSARLLLDNGSTSNFITIDLCKKLKLHTRTTNIQVSGINNQISNSNQTCTLRIESYYDGYTIDVECLILSKITSTLPSSHINITHLNIPKGIQLSDPAFNTPSSINLLVGADIFWSVIGTQYIHLGKHKPVLWETRLGWIVSGAVHDAAASQSVCMFAHEEHADLTRFWQLDTILDKHNRTAEENACEQSFLDNTIRGEDGRFIVKIPLKEPGSALGNSVDMARCRFFSLERRFNRDSEFKTRYVDFINEYISLGHMTGNTLPSNEAMSYYLPHHGVIRESSTTTKLRVVFDASAVTTSGKSFNQIQMIGPTVQDDLLSILLRFRQHKYVVTADIEKMYRQIEVHSSQRYLQQILWRSSPSEPLKSYTLNTVTYGTASAPYLSTRCLLQLSTECASDDVRRAIAHDFYVDDWLSGSDTKQQTIELCRNVISVLDAAKFNLRKWQTNNQDILLAISKHRDLGADTVNLSQNEQSKTLGLHWRCATDTLTFSVNNSHNQIITKRNILSTIAQIFDPLGLVSPCIIEAKILMQALWTEKCTWDEEVPNQIKTAWTHFQNTIQALNKTNIPRWITAEFTNNIQLHIFSDASEKAYGACIYVRCQKDNGTISVRLLTSKSKVAPIKVATIPRLELCAALLGSRLCTKALSSVTFKPSNCIFWCDSTIVLSWLATPFKQFKPFVRNRVCEIQETHGHHTWRYVPSRENPADLVSRGMSADNLVNCNLWWSGPQFLSNCDSTWPNATLKLKETELPETMTALHIIQNSDEEKDNPLHILVNKKSNLKKLQNIVAYIHRFIHNCRSNNKLYGSLTLSELKHSTITLLKTAQQYSFLSEYNVLASGGKLPCKNRLLSLNPFIDGDGLIRVGGRLDNSFYDYDVKHPVLLCSKYHLSKIILHTFHLRLLHAGPQLLLTTVRHKYWILGGRNLARFTVRNCIKCCRYQGKTVQPIMGNLPTERVTLEFPFIDTGVDYCGPMQMADRKGRGSRTIKCYISVFVCLATRALHLELVSELTKEAFVAALNRFIARRGKPRNIFSDNGTTFVGTFNELTSILQQNYSDYATDLGINFSFIPAYSPHFGGLWESAVKSTKHHLRRILGSAHLTYEEMNTLIIQVEAILNSRPLTPLSTDPSDLTPLTPSHFLIGRSPLFAPGRAPNETGLTNIQRYKRVETLKGHFWKRFSNEYITWLQQRTKWVRSRGELQEGDMVLIKDKLSPPLFWPLGRIIHLYPGRDGISRVADIKTKRGVLRRSFDSICLLPRALLKTSLQRREDVGAATSAKPATSTP